MNKPQSSTSAYTTWHLGRVGISEVVAVCAAWILGAPLLLTVVAALGLIFAVRALAFTWGSSSTAGMLAQTEEYGRWDAASRA